MSRRTVQGNAHEGVDSAFPGGRTTPPPACGEILRQAADPLERRTADVARDLARQRDKPLCEATGLTGSSGSREQGTGARQFFTCWKEESVPGYTRGRGIVRMAWRRKVAIQSIAASQTEGVSPWIPSSSL